MVSSDRHRYIVAVDFGTTFTGISHVNATKKNIDDIQIIKNWPGPSKEFAEVIKCPSRIAYRSENKHLTNIRDDAEEIIWGFDVEPGMISYSWMKLRLDDHAKITQYDDTSLAGLANSQGEGLLRLPKDKTALQVCTDYLSGVYKYTIKELNRNWTESIVLATPIDFWVTVPATWSDRAKDLTKKAALAAGFAARRNDRMFLITEPEAAAVAALTELVGEGVQNQLEPGDGLLVCDCGGGTVDINTYRVTATTPRLEFDELVVGEGGKVGSTFIDRQLWDWMGARFGCDFYELDYKKKGPGSRFMREFEAIKRDFGGTRNSQKEFRIPLKIKNAVDSQFYDEEENMVIITREDMGAFFEPSMTKIKRLLKDQIAKANHEMGGAKTVRTIILVGGFGDSPHLFSSLQDWCKSNGNLRLLCPPMPQAAIVRGAALRGLGDIKPSRRRARRHYGFLLAERFQQGVHPEELAFICEWSRIKYCNNVYAWEIKKGDYVTEHTKIEFVLDEVWFVRDSKCGSLALYASSEDQAATYHYAHDTNSDCIGILNYDFEALDMTLLPTRRIKGRRAYRVNLTVQIYMGDKQGAMIFKVVSQGKEIGTAALDFNQLEDRASSTGLQAYA